MTTRETLTYALVATTGWVLGQIMIIAVLVTAG